MASTPVPRDRDNFHVAIISALAHEFECVHNAFDKIWDGKKYAKTSGDDNAYVLGAVGKHNVVLVYMPSMGAIQAAAAVTNLKLSFKNIKLAIVVGVCGGIPYSPRNEEIILGDVIISESLVRYDFGKQYAHGFQWKTDMHDILGPPTEKILALLNRLKIRQHRTFLQLEAESVLKDIQQILPKRVYPGVENDILYHSSYVHRHHAPELCIECGIGNGACKAAITSQCEELRCDRNMSVKRQRLVASSSHPSPRIHFGPMASVNEMLRSGRHRDMLAKDGIFAIEMEGAGVWSSTATIVIKGVCDYGDGHRSKGWQLYAAATAAAYAKAFLLQWPPEKPMEHSGNQQDSVQMARELLQITAEDHSDYVEHLNNLATSLSVRYRHKRNLVDLSEAINLARRVLLVASKDHANRRKYLDNLRTSLTYRYEQTKSAIDLQDAIDVTKQFIDTFPETQTPTAEGMLTTSQDPAVLITMGGLGQLYANQGKLLEAEQSYVQALSGQEQLLGRNHLQTLMTMKSLGKLYADQGKVADAEQMYEQALSGLNNVLGSAHTFTLDVVEKLGGIYHAQEKLHQAEETYSLVLGVAKNSHHSTSAFSILQKLSSLYVEQGRLKDSESVNAEIQARREIGSSVSSNVNIEFSDDESEVSDAPSLISDSTEVSLNEGYAVVVEHMADLLREDEKTSAIYRGIGELMDSKMFIRVHDQILKLYFQDLRNEVKHANELQTVCALRKAPQRKEITSLVLNFSQPTTFIGISTNRAVERKKVLNAMLLSLPNTDMSIHNENVSESSDPDSGPDVGDDEIPPEESMFPLQAVESFLTGGKAFQKLQANLASLLYQPRNIEEAMLSDSIFVLKRFLKKNLGNIEGKWKDQILRLRSKGYSNMKMAKVLLGHQKPVEVDVKTKVKYDIEVYRHETMLPSGTRSFLEKLWWFFSEYLRSVGNALILCESLRHLGYLVESCSTVRSCENLRLKWTCKCGQRRVFDLRSNDIAAAHQLGARLTQYAHQGVPANSVPMVSSLTAASGQTAKSATQPSGSSSISTLGGSATSTIQTSGASTTNTATGGISHALSTPRFLLVCINEANLTTALAQIPCQRYCSDQSLFASIRRKYDEKSSRPLRWYSFMIPNRVELVRFVIVPRKSSTKSHQRVGVLRPVPSIPPAEEVTVYQRYHYEPCTLKVNDIPMREFVHAFLEPGEHTDDYWVQSLPKKLLAELQYVNSRTQAIGWGVHIQEELNMLVVTLLLIASLVSTTLFCILWTTVRHGAIQDSYSMGGYILTLEGLVFTFLYFFWQRLQIYQY